MYFYIHPLINIFRNTCCVIDWIPLPIIQFASQYKSHSLRTETENSKRLYALHLILRSACL